MFRSESSNGLRENLENAFGPHAKMYMKNQAADQDLFGRYSSSGSGSSTPHQRHHVQAHEGARAGGRLTVHHVPPKSSEASGSGSGSGSGTGGTGFADFGKKEGSEDRIWDMPRSKDVKRLEEIREKLLAVQEGNGKVQAKPYPECFCQARNHPLSSYTPICQHCGLVVCSLHSVYLPCPSCQNLLFSPAQLARILLTIEMDIKTQLAIEKAERDAIERERQERLVAESGGGAFPTLNGGPPRPTPVPAALPAQERRVLTLGKGKGGKGRGRATLTTTTIRPIASPSTTPGEPVTPPPDDIYPRPRSPPLDIVRVAKELGRVMQWREEEDRPWGKLKADKGGGAPLAYVELPIEHFIEDHVEGRRKAAKKKKEGRGVDGRVVPGAAAA
ncbi:hypothetical protein BD324DRAFT_234906 [Kockovaella imperatae]|uniref:TRIP4/RQT4 C2HC5-type zinc finger domain-containing protein n=1 Tax=Kockovaella imperatae TaxID=4999 RepID=A0A1Y1UP63_9TREE|nr:hypothetical protein BD324DRAFT_234906 [Kockovaella imperatae]ORX39792.1 hypothetical protein BD324DRAFT_234906 [Kockovaella imperatae]